MISFNQSVRISLDAGFEFLLFQRAPEVDEHYQEYQDKHEMLMIAWNTHGAARCPSTQGHPCDLCKRMEGNPFYVRDLTGWINQAGFE